MAKNAERENGNKLNGALREPARQEREGLQENIFLFVPNIIGVSFSRVILIFILMLLQVTPVSYLLSYRCITCLYIRADAASSTVYPVS